MMMLLKGICLVMTDGAPIAGTSKTFAAFGTGSILGVYNITWVAVLLFVISLWVMKRTEFGRNCYAVGYSKDVAAYSGVAVKRHLWVTFIISACSAALAGFCLSAELNSGSAAYGDNTALLINCGVVVGGTPFNGGYGGMVQSLIGVFLFGLLENVMNLLAVTPYMQMLIRGILIVLVIGMDCYARKKKTGRCVIMKSILCYGDSNTWGYIPGKGEGIQEISAGRAAWKDIWAPDIM